MEGVSPQAQLFFFFFKQSLFSERHFLLAGEKKLSFSVLRLDLGQHSLLFCKVPS